MMTENPYDVIRAATPSPYVERGVSFTDTPVGVNISHRSTGGAPPPGASAGTEPGIGQAAGPASSAHRMPVLYLSHGAPPLADDGLWTGELAAWGRDLPKPRAILVVSAHWEAAPVTIGATATVPLTYDFWGFPEHYYQVRYAAPGAPELAQQVAALVARPGRPLHQDPTRGLDHGAYVPLVEMYPNADVPVLQVSMPTLDPRELFELGRTLAPLRDDGVLIMGSGFTTHNLREARVGDVSGSAPQWGREFDEWAREAVEGGDIDAVLDFENTAPAAHLAHPRTEHFAPLFVALGATADAGVRAESVIDGFWYGLAKRSFQFN